MPAQVWVPIAAAVALLSGGAWLMVTLAARQDASVSRLTHRLADQLRGLEARVSYLDAQVLRSAERLGEQMTAMESRLFDVAEDQRQSLERLAGHQDHPGAQDSAD